MDTRTIAHSMVVARLTARRTSGTGPSTGDSGRRCFVTRRAAGRKPGCASAGTAQGTTPLTRWRLVEISRLRLNVLRQKPVRGAGSLLKGTTVMCEKPRPGCHPASAIS
jgi:hypothetical protein